MFGTKLQVTKHLRSAGQCLVILLLGLWSVPPGHAQSPGDAAFTAALGELREAAFTDKEAIVERLSKAGHPSVRAVLTAFMEDRLYFRNEDQKVVIVKTTEGDPPVLDLIDPQSLKAAGSTPADSLTKIGTNNRLRRVLRTTVAHFGLSNPDPAVRLDAVRNMLRSLDEGTVTLLRERIDQETNSSVKQEIATGLALAALDGSDKQERLNAIATLRRGVSQDVRNKLASLIDKSPDGNFVESDEQVRSAASSALRSVDRWRTFYSGIQTLFFGLSSGSVFVLIAIVLAIIFGLMRVINIAAGTVRMVDVIADHGL